MRHGPPAPRHGSIPRLAALSRNKLAESLWRGESRRQSIHQTTGNANGLHDVGTPARMAWPCAVIHENPRSPRGSDLPPAGRGGRALEGNSDRGRPEEESAGRRPVEHVHATVVA